MDCPKICYFLKEAYTYEGKYDLPNLVKELKNKEPWSMWKKFLSGHKPYIMLF